MLDNLPVLVCIINFANTVDNNLIYHNNHLRVAITNRDRVLLLGRSDLLVPELLLRRRDVWWPEMLPTRWRHAITRTINYCPSGFIGAIISER
jgi:hypothetical protein